MRELSQLAEALAAASALPEVGDAFDALIRPLGFDAFTLGSAPLRKGKVDSSGVAFYSTLPQAFQDEYLDEKMERLDPVFDLMASRFTPFTKSSIDPVYEGSPHRAGPKDLADEHGLGDALMIPINTADHSRGVVLFTRLSVDELAERIERDGPLLHAAALAVMDHAVRLGFGLAPAEEVRLTDRERDCLELCAQGQTHDEIAAALGVAERTVRFHLGNCYQKLGARSGSHAVTRAVQLGLIRT